jgi:hypothetical protein
MKVIATICSKEKDPSTELLPAVERYRGEHIQIARAEAIRIDSPLYILSGKFGLVSGDDFIADYDYLLEMESAELTRLVKSQMEEAGITEVEFYYKEKGSWAPYRDTLRNACTLGRVALHNHKL